MLNKIEELSLITRCIAGDDRNAFGQLVVAYEAGLRRFLLNLTLGDQALSEDLSQEAFLKAYLSIRQFKGIASFKTWLYRIAYNEFLSYHRQHHEDSLNENSYNSPSFSPQNATEAKIDIQTMLKELNETERTCVLLFYLEDYPIKKISKITTLSEGTIKSHLSRAKTKMKKIL